MKKVLVIADTSRVVGRQMLSGAQRYISAFAHWQVHTRPPEYLHGPKRKIFNLDLLNFDGLFICDAPNISQVLAVNIPKVVHNSHNENVPGASLIITDSDKIGKMVADYYISLGFRNFVYCGFNNLFWSDKRFASFSAYLLEKGLSNIFEYRSGQSSSQIDERASMAKWLKNLPKPLCVFACNDDCAIYVLEACKAVSINVPEEVAVIGVDNDELVCNLSSPPLSSVLLNFENTGFEAAKHLDQLMSGDRKTRILLVQPLEIIKRQSTDILATDNKEVISALVYIRNNFHKQIQVTDVVAATNLSRRELEYRFKQFLRKTIKAEINRLRTDYIKKKLLNSNESVKTIAHGLSFSDTEHFCRYFKGLVGLSPLKFRKMRRLN
ncbi:MAG: hypothetical protein A2Y07_06145 [Planctomycetes bacterium GWF2_50_10]|nr:MAG: hypothetical protein A2Y07_06145 [Planctomycetes bacterium GWF2_50_10]